MPTVRTSLLVAIALSLGFHAGLLVLPNPQRPLPVSEPLQVSIVDTPVQTAQPATQPVLPTKPSMAESAPARIADSIPLSPAPVKSPASMSAPPPPTSEEWEQASTYTLKNSKRYRYNWGQLVRSKMGTAVEGLRQGLVRFRIEIASDGKLAKVEVLWSTSEIAEELALQAIRSLPPLPPTPTGKPLVFEKTISFMPFETGWPPSYKLDCLPDPLKFNNPFAWDGSSKGYPAIVSPSHRPPPPDDCITDSTADTIEQEEAEMKRQYDQWRWGR